MILSMGQWPKNPYLVYLIGSCTSIIAIKHGNKIERSAHCAVYIYANTKNHTVLISPLWATACKTSFISTPHLELQSVSREIIKRLTEIEKRTMSSTETAHCEKGLWTTTTRFTTFNLTNPQTLCVSDSRYIHTIAESIKKKRVLSAEYWKACDLWYKPLKPHYRVALHHHFCVIFLRKAVFEAEQQCWHFPFPSLAAHSVLMTCRFCFLRAEMPIAWFLVIYSWSSVVYDIPSAILIFVLWLTAVIYWWFYIPWATNTTLSLMSGSYSLTHSFLLDNQGKNQRFLKKCYTSLLVS